MNIKHTIHYLAIPIFFVTVFSGCDESAIYPDTNTTIDNNTTTKNDKKSAKLFPIDTKMLFSNKKCSQVIQKTGYKTCYDYGLKALTLNAYELDGSRVNAPDPIDERPSFFEEESIPEQYRASYGDYTGYDRGHMRTDASSDYDQDILDETYSLGGNILAQYSGLNRYVWVDVEKYSRRVAVDKGMLNIINIAVYDKPAKRNRNNMAVPKGFYKILYTGDGTLDGFAECYYYENIQYDSSTEGGDTHEKYEVNCDTIELGLEQTEVIYL